MGMKKVLLYHHQNKNVEPKQNSQQYGNVLSMMFSAYGTLTDKEGNNFQPTIRLQLKSQRRKFHSQTQLYIKEKQFQKEAFLDISQRRRYRATSPGGHSHI